MSDSELPQLLPGVDPCTIPAAIPPAGKNPNLVDPVTLAPVLIGVSVTTLTWAVTLTAGRLYVRFGDFKCPDHLAAIAMVLATAYTGVILSTHKYFRHQWDVPVCWLNASYFKTAYTHMVINAPLCFSSKAAILLLYFDIFTAHGSMRIAIYFGLVLDVLHSLPGLAIASYYLAPHAGQSWQQLSPNPWGPTVWGLVQGPLSVVLDLYIFILPIPLISRLRLPRRKRVQVFGIFSSALIGIVASVIGLILRVEMATTSDITWVYGCNLICFMVENNVAIIVASIPGFAKFIKTHVSKPVAAQIEGSAFAGGLGHDMRRVPPWSRLVDSLGFSRRDTVDEDGSLG